MVNRLLPILRSSLASRFLTTSEATVRPKTMTGVQAFEASRGGTSLQGALESMTWMTQDERAELFKGVIAGDEEASLCVLLSMLKGLKVLKTFTTAKRT